MTPEYWIILALYLLGCVPMFAWMLDRDGKNYPAAITLTILWPLVSFGCLCLFAIGNNKLRQWTMSLEFGRILSEHSRFRRYRKRVSVSK